MPVSSWLSRLAQRPRDSDASFLGKMKRRNEKDDPFIAASQSSYALPLPISTPIKPHLPLTQSEKSTSTMELVVRKRLPWTPVPPLINFDPDLPPGSGENMSPSSFINLPRELRDQIYRFYMELIPYKITAYFNEPFDNDRDGSRFLRSKISQRSPQAHHILLYVNRQIHDEYEELMAKHMKCVFYLNRRSDEPSYPLGLWTLSPIVAANLRSCEIVIDLSSPELVKDCYHHLRGLIKKFHNFINTLPRLEVFACTANSYVMDNKHSTSIRQLVVSELCMAIEHAMVIDKPFLRKYCCWQDNVGQTVTKSRQGGWNVVAWQCGMPWHTVAFHLYRQSCCDQIKVWHVEDCRVAIPRGFPSKFDS